MIKSASRFFVTLSLVLAWSLTAAAPANAEVRIGKNVRIGGHDVSNQTFNRKRRGKYIIYKGKPKRPGCRWQRNKDGSKTKICHLQRKKRK